MPAGDDLDNTSVPSGSLLVVDGYANPDRVDAINPATGTVIATLVLHDNLDANAGVYDPATGDLYLLRGIANQVAVVDPNTGLTLAQFAAPEAVDYWNGGLALDPTSGQLWLGSSSSNMIYEVNKSAGAVLQKVDLSSQGVAGIAGLAFNASGQLLVASTDGVVFGGHDDALAGRRTRRCSPRSWRRPERHAGGLHQGLRRRGADHHPGRDRVHRVHRHHLPDPGQQRQRRHGHRHPLGVNAAGPRSRSWCPTWPTPAP